MSKIKFEENTLQVNAALAAVLPGAKFHWGTYEVDWTFELGDLIIKRSPAILQMKYAKKNIIRAQGKMLAIAEKRINLLIAALAQLAKGNVIKNEHARVSLIIGDGHVPPEMNGFFDYTLHVSLPIFKLEPTPPGSERTHALKEDGRLYQDIEGGRICFRYEVEHPEEALPDPWHVESNVKFLKEMKSDFGVCMKSKNDVLVNFVSYEVPRTVFDAPFCMWPDHASLPPPMETIRKGSYRRMEAQYIVSGKTVKDYLKPI